MSANRSKSRCFVDTNILIYAVDETDEKKNVVANRLIEELIGNSSLYLSSQCMREFLNVYSKSQPGNMGIEDALEYARVAIGPYMRTIETASFFDEAVSRKISHGVGFYDALIIQAAIELNCRILYSEDFEHGRVYSGVEVINPFI